MVSKKMTELQPWECLMKRIVWKQLGDIRDKKILDFGSGIGVTANYLAEHNDVTAIEPDEDSVKEGWADNQYTQITGSTDELRRFTDESFDMIICHNVLEYAKDRENIILVITKTLGMRTFWDMQQNQEIHKDTDWQDKMVEIEMRVSDMDGYKEIAFFHHLIIEKRWC